MTLPTRSPDARYLGDGLYADIENGMIRLTAENGMEATNTVYLEPEVLAEFHRWLDDLKKGFRRVQPDDRLMGPRGASAGDGAPGQPLPDRRKRPETP